MFQFTTRKSSDEQKLTAGGTVPAGFYTARIVEVAEATSKAGNAQLVVTFEVDPIKGRTIDVREYYPLMQSTAWKIERLLAACGHRFAEGETVTLNRRMLEGKKLTVATFNEASQKNGMLYVRILSPVCANDVPHTGVMTAEELEQFGLAADGTRANTAPAVSQSPAPAPVSTAGLSTMQKQARGLMPHEEEDDIPF